MISVNKSNDTNHFLSFAIVVSYQRFLSIDLPSAITSKFVAMKKQAIIFFLAGVFFLPPFVTNAQTSRNGKFTIVLLPDTQYYTAEPQGMRGGNNEIFKREIKWIVANRTTRNIVYVGHLGDCSEHGDAYEVEWKRSDTAMKLLEDANVTGLPQGIPYGICVGNHDQSPNGNFSGTTSFYNKYFGITRFKGRTYYAGHFGTNNDNFYQVFTVGSINFLVIYFEYDVSSNFTAKGGALDWGESVIKKYPNYNVIVLSHYVLTARGSFTTQGLSIYKRFKMYPNFKLMSGGHVWDAEAMRKDSYNGNTAYTILSNYQGRMNGGNGLFRIYEFDTANNSVAIKTYSPYLGFEKDSDSQFTLNLTLIRNNSPLAAASSASITGIGNGHETLDGNILEIYPNPNHTNNVTLSFAKEIKGKLLVEIYDMNGKLLLEQQFLNIEHTISFTHNLRGGIYAVHVTTETGKVFRKLLVIRK